MARNDNERQSSLPSSLIPHLYSAPQHARDSSTRTTIDPDENPYQQHPVSHVLFPFPRQRRTSFLSYDADQQANYAPPPPAAMPPHQFGGPIYTDPLSYSSSRPSRAPTYTFPPPPPPRDFVPSQRATWSEGEAGPSSLMHSDHRVGRLRRGSSLSPRVAPPTDAFGRGNANFEHQSSFGDVVRRDAERDPYFSLSGPSMHQQHQMNTYFSQSSQSFQQPPQLLLPESDEAFSFRHDPYPYPAMGNLSLSTPSPSDFRSSSSVDSSFMYHSDSRGGDPTSQDEFDVGTRDNKRQRADSVDVNDSPESRKQRIKTSVACNFCRGRKLRCNGVRPACSHCIARSLDCVYDANPRRRGPGKKAKGMRSKKATAKLEPSSSTSNIGTDRQLPNTVTEYELKALAPEVRPYTSVMSLGSLETFAFDPPAPAPRYPSGLDQGFMREYYSRARTARSRETSSEDRSDADRNE